MAASVTKIQQLLVQVFGGLASKARVVTIRPGTTLITMANSAGPCALRHAVFERRGCLCTHADTQAKNENRTTQQPRNHAAELTSLLLIFRPRFALFGG
jgi:hypothetical protein